uniref:Uncharacterized protein ycf23 n=1 Tax=Neoizziella asiatica TaxID=1077397 RepID=A0A1G4NWV0_9FLOR|nr:Hypothetical protein ycf23 [Neoizziella asiatica]SCW23140.1 Hypothetical protein ycf23 [Neoizziella asiatica]
MTLHYSIQEACAKKQVIKTIIGIDNFSFVNSIDKIKAAEIAGSTYIDIAANVDMLLEAKLFVSLPICVSSICVQELLACSKAGADMLEIGNFDSFYNKKITLTSQDILAMVQELKYRDPEVSICVTIPHVLSIEQQIGLAKQLDKLGIDMIQTEGWSSKQADLVDISDVIRVASATVGNVLALADAVDIPVVASSGISSLTAPMAISCGAAGVGVGSFFNYFGSGLELSKEINEMKNTMKLNAYSRYNMQKYLLEKDRLNALSKVT